MAGYGSIGNTSPPGGMSADSEEERDSIRTPLVLPKGRRGMRRQPASPGGRMCARESSDARRPGDWCPTGLEPSAPLVQTHWPAGRSSDHPQQRQPDEFCHVHQFGQRRAPSVEEVERCRGHLADGGHRTLTSPTIMAPLTSYTPHLYLIHKLPLEHHTTERFCCTKGKHLDVDPFAQGLRTP